MPETKSRMVWADYLRAFTILLVVSQHACVTYSHVGSWYVNVDPAPPELVTAVFALWQAHLQAFFMGLLFFLAGYFAHRSLSRRGGASFMRERLIRLGIPTLVYMLLIHPFILLGLNPWGTKFPPIRAFYVGYLRSGRFLGASGPLWFAFALLIMSAAFAGYRSLRPAPALEPLEAVSGKSLLGIGLLMALLSFLVRAKQPIGTDILNMQLCFFSQYIIAFWAGVYVARRRGLEVLANASACRKAGLAALCLGAPALIALMAAGGMKIEPFTGGWRWQAFGYAFWEQMTGLGLAVGFIWLFSHRFNEEKPLWGWMSDRSFGVYVFHPPILVAITMLLRLHGGNALVMAALLTVSGLIASFLFADTLRRVPLLASVF